MSLFSGCFRRLVETPARNELKGYKVTNANRTRKIGVACRSLQELKRKACLKLNITHDLVEVNVFLLDGSLVDEEYFSTLQPQTTLVLQKPGEKVFSDADLFYDTLRRVNIDFLTAGDKVSQFLTEKLKNKVAILNKVLNKDDSKTAFSTREEHPEWFCGLETNCTTKEAYMHRRCQDRIRGYLYKTIEQIKSSDVYANDPKAKQNLLYAIAFFRVQLKQDHYFGYYFDRSRAKDAVEQTGDQTDSSNCYDHCPCRLNCLEDNVYFRLFGTPEFLDRSCVDDVDGRKSSKIRTSAAGCSDNTEQKDKRVLRIQPHDRHAAVALCDRKGEFRCEGVWNNDGCSYGDRHKINPYRSKEELILFSTWNLDHKIERSRSLVPQLLEISVRGTINGKDVRECYNNLFTVKNLRLVHIVCHDKGAHK